MLNPKRVTGYIFEEKCMWHDPGPALLHRWVEPARHWENVETKRRFHNLLNASGMIDVLVRIRGRHAFIEELQYVHDSVYVEKIKIMSENNGGSAGEDASFSKGAFEIATLAAGSSIQLVDSILSGRVQNGYALIRPPGHHATAMEGMGFCLFNNIAIVACHVLKNYPHIKRIVIFDFDVHHGNGSQEAFETDPRVLFISIHQDGNYPKNTGKIDERGAGLGMGYTINIPLPPGSGEGAYTYALKQIVIPAIEIFEPHLMLISCGFDASYMDPLAHMMLSSEDFRSMTSSLLTLAEKYCHGRIAFFHEGGYSDIYVPFCGLAVIEALAGCRTEVVDPFLEEAQQLAQQSLQPHQKSAIDSAQKNLTLLENCVQNKSQI